MDEPGDVFKKLTRLIHDLTTFVVLGPDHYHQPLGTGIRPDSGMSLTKSLEGFLKIRGVYLLFPDRMKERR